MENPHEFTLVNRRFRELNPISFGHQQCPPSHAYGPATRFYYLIHYIVSGKGMFVRQGQTYALHAGQCFVIRPDETTYYEADRADPWQYIWIGFTASLPLPDRMTSAVIESKRAAILFPEMLSYLQTEVEQPEIYLTARLWELYSHFACHDRTTLPIAHTESLMLRAKNVIETEYMHEITVEGLAKRLHLERSYFSTLFKKQFGMSPQQYLVDYRLSVAALLMTRYHYTPSLAARASGYTDPCNFSRMFRRKYGVTPGQYRRSPVVEGERLTVFAPLDEDT